MVPEFIDLPKDVTFADGSATATVTIAIGEDMGLFTDYQLSFRIPEEYTNAYAGDGKSPIFNITIKKEDYKVVANGIYQAAVYYTDEEGNPVAWDQPVEYSEIMSLYRMPNCMVNGTHWYFAFNGSDEFTFTTKDGEPTTKFLTGIVNSVYGAVAATLLTAYPYGYNPAGPEGTEGYFKFPLQYTVSAGSFGYDYEYLFISKWLEKPWESEVAE